MRMPLNAGPGSLAMRGLDDAEVAAPEERHEEQPRVEAGEAKSHASCRVSAVQRQHRDGPNERGVRRGSCLTARPTSARRTA